MFACALAIGALGCGSPLEGLEGNGNGHVQVQIPPIALETAVFEGYHGDLRDLSITSATAIVDTTTKLAHLSDVAIGFSGDDQQRLQIQAPTGVFQLDGDDFTLSGGVKGLTGEGEAFTTNEVHYIGKRRVLHSDVPVEIARSNVVLTGSGMELELAHQKLRLLGNVRARVKPQ